MAVSITSILIGALSALAIVVLVLLVLVSKQRKRVNSLLFGKNGISLEESITNLIAKVENMDKTIGSHKDALNFIDTRVKKSIRGYSLVKYNAYSDNGGEQSFASGLLDESKNGYVLSVIVNRNHVGVYAKNIIKGNPETPLTEEENQALEEAKKSL
jgi:hypothetical protein